MAGRMIGKTKRAVQTSQALELRLSGWSIPAIAAELGIGRATVQRRIDDALASQIEPRADQLRALYNSRYERLLDKLNPLVDQGDVAAIKAASIILDHLRRVHGIDEPTRSSAVVEVVSPEDIELREMVNAIEQRNADTMADE
jgi:hypothetical protein